MMFAYKKIVKNNLWTIIRKDEILKIFESSIIFILKND